MVDTLEHRYASGTLAGSQGVRGSNPLSSTPMVGCTGRLHGRPTIHSVVDLDLSPRRASPFMNQEIPNAHKATDSNHKTGFRS